MAKLDEVFNVADAPEGTGFEPIPPGAYNAMIVASSIKQTSTGGQMIVLELDIQGGDYAGRKLFDRLNIKNNNPKAVEIAFRTLAEISKAVGKTSIKDTDELHDKRLVVNVKVTPPQAYVKDGVQHAGSPQNAISRYLPYTGGAAPAASAPATRSPVASDMPDAASVPPWKKKKV